MNQTNHRRATTLAAAALLTLASAAMGAEKKVEKITLADAPAAVQAAVKSAAGDREMKKVERVTGKKGKVSFKAEWDAGTVEHAVRVNPAGEVLEAVDGIAATDLPAAVSTAVKGKYADGQVVETNKVTAKGETSYEIDVKSGGQRHELTVSPDGSVTKDKVEDEGKGDKPAATTRPASR